MLDGLYAVVMSGSLIGIFLQVVPITFLVGLVYAIYRLVKIRKRELSVSWGAEIMRWLFVCYLTGLINFAGIIIGYFITLGIKATAAKR